LSRYLSALSIILLFALCAFGQNTTVSGTITDAPDGQPWFNGTFSFVFRVSPSNPTAQYFLNGVPFSSAQTIAGTLDGSAHYSVSVPSNTSITPAGSSWDLTVCPLATASCLTVQSITITGATQTVSPIPPSIRINLSSPPQNPRAYTDAEAVNGSLGQTYFNITSTVIRVCSVFPCGWTNSSGGTSITLKTNGSTNPVQSVLNIIGGTAITTTSDGSGGVTVASTIGPPCNTQNVIQAANGSGGYQCTNLSEAGGVLTNADQNSNRGPNPGVDITAPPFNARAVSTSAIPLTTGTITGGTNALVVASNTGWQKNDGFSLVGAGATNCGTPPAAPTGFAALASSMTGTGHFVAGDTGSTSYSYVVVAVSQGGCYTAASPILTISNGNATLGATNLPITSCVNSAGTVTCTMGSTASLASGMWTRIGGTLDDTEFGGRHTITVINGTQFTYQSMNSSIYPMKSTTTTGGTLYFWPENGITLPPLPAGTNMYKEVLYRCIGTSCALPANAANYSPIYVSYPLNLTIFSFASTYGKFDDYGTISTVTANQSLPWFIPTTPPATNVNDMLVTTVTGIVGTAFTLATNATNTVGATSCNGGTCSLRFDDAPAITAAEAASNTVSPGGGGAVHIPPPLSASLFGTTCYITSSYLVLNSIINVGGAFCPGETVELSGNRGALLGKYEDTIHSSTPGFGVQTLLQLSCLGANPCILRNGPQIRDLLINGGGPSQTLVFDKTNAQTLTENVHFNVTDGMGIAVYAYGNQFGGVYRNIGLTGGPTQTIGLVDTPLFLVKEGVQQTTIDNVTGSLRGLYFECSNVNCAFFIIVRQGDEWQGPITPLVTVNAISGRAGMIYLEHMVQDSGVEPIFVNATTSAGTMSAPVVINGTNPTGADPGTPAGDNQPLISGNPINAGVSLLTTNSVSAGPSGQAGINHDLIVCSGQPAINASGYTGCTLPALNLATATYSGNHTLTGSEGIVNETATGTITVPHALAGQSWIVYCVGGTCTLAIDSGTLSCNGATGSCTIPVNQGVMVFADGTNARAFGLGGGSGGSPGGTTNALQLNGGGSSFAGVNSPTVNGNYVVNYNVTASASVPATITLPGVPVNPQTGTTYTEGSANTQSDRGYLVTANNSGAQTYTMVNPSAAGFGFNYFNVLKNIGTGAVTENASGFTVNGGASLLVPPSWTRWLWSDGVNYFASRIPDFGAFPNCTGGGNALQFTSATGVFGCGSSASGVSSITGDSVLITNSLSTGAVTLTLGTAGAHKVWMNNTAGTATPGYQSIGEADLPTTTVFTDKANTYGAFLQDFSAGTMKIPTSAGCTAGATAMICYDSTNKNWHIYDNNADAIGLAIAAAPTNGDLADYAVVSGNVLAHDSGVATANVVTAASAASAAKQSCVSSGASKTCTYIDHPDVQIIPAANCNNVTAGAGWSIGSGGTVTCRAGTNNKGGFVSITDTSSTFATFQTVIPEDWDSGTLPYIRFQIASTDATNAHTIIPSIQVACYKGDGSTTDDVAANAAHSLSTVTLNGNANRFWSTANVQMNSTDMTGCVAGALMQVTVGRATDTATNAEFYSATLTFPRLLTVQAN
jgi:hypothetical protein